MKVLCLFLSMIAYSFSASPKESETPHKKLNRKLNEQANYTLRTFTSGKVTWCSWLQEGAFGLIKLLDIKKIGKGAHISNFTAAVYGNFSRGCPQTSLKEVMEEFQTNLTEWISQGPVGYGCAGKRSKRRSPAKDGVFVCVLLKGNTCKYPKKPSAPARPKRTSQRQLNHKSWMEQDFDQ